MSRRLPTIRETKTTGDELSLKLFISQDILYFEGHFMDFQLLPGVVQIAWVVDYAKSFFQIDRRFHFKNLENVKFVRPIFPDQEVTLEMKYERTKNVLAFEFKNSKTRFSTGKIKFERTDGI